MSIGEQVLLVLTDSESCASMQETLLTAAEQALCIEQVWIRDFPKASGNKAGGPKGQYLTVDVDVGLWQTPR
jgi:hypothetical protein